jgi:drug/metabolite transporter (DMT)-like permease
MSSIYILIAIFLWSSLGIFVRLSGVPVHILIFYANGVSLIIQAIILSRKNYHKQLIQVKNLRYPLILGFFSLINTYTYFYAFQNTTIANAVLTHYTAPVIVALLAPVFIGEIITKRLIVVILLASAGLWIMLNGFSLEETMAAGIIAGLISGLAYAIIIILLRKYSQQFHPLVLAFFINLFLGIFLLPFIRDIPFKAVWIFLVMGIIHSTIAPILYYKGLQKVTANKAAVLGYLEPVCAIMLSVIFLFEMPGINTILGGLLIIFSGYLALRD